MHIKEVSGFDIVNVTIGCALYKVKLCIVVCTIFGLHEDDNVIWATLRQDVTDTATWYDGLCKIRISWL